jgi:hypothetical protein
MLGGSSSARRSRPTRTPLAPALTDASWWVPANGCSDAPPREESCVGPAWIADPARPLEQPNQRRGRIELAGIDTVASRLREGVVGVVPRLAHRQDRQGREVRAVVTRVERAFPEGVTNRVDAPGEVLHEAHPNRARPEQRGEPSRHLATR